MLKKDDQSLSWIAHYGESKKIKDRWLESTKSPLPLVIVGDSGVGKTFWIEKSIEIRIRDKKYKIFHIDYNEQKEFFDATVNQIKKEKNAIVWWENLSQTSDDEIKKWNRWWQEKKYQLTESLFLYWEIQSSELDIIEKNITLKDFFDQFKPFLFQISGLHRRQSDLPLFVQNFLDHANRDLKKSVLSLDENFHQYFTKRKFKHNLHELRDFIYSLVAFSTKKHIKFNQIPIHMFESNHNDIPVQTGITLYDYEKAIIKENLKLVSGNRVKAAKILGISERNLYRKIKEFQLDTED